MNYLKIVRAAFWIVVTPTVAGSILAAFEYPAYRWPALSVLAVNVGACFVMRWAYGEAKRQRKEYPL